MAITRTAQPWSPPPGWTPKPEVKPEPKAWVWRQGPLCIGDPGSHYNGWSWDERTAVTPLQKQATREGLIRKPSVCQITGEGASYVYQHNENYGDHLVFYAVGRFVHSALHARFTEPLSWNRLVRKHYVHGAWFTFLTMDPADMQRPYEEIYPEGLPADGEVWPEMADRLGLSPHAFVTSKQEAACNGLHRGNLFRDGLPPSLKVRYRRRTT